MDNWSIALTGLLLIMAKIGVDKVLSIRKAFREAGDCPGRHILWLDPFRTLSIALAQTYPRPGSFANWGVKFAPYAQTGSTCIASVHFLTSRLYFWISDADAIKMVTSDRLTFQKDVPAYEFLNIYGENLVSTEHADWKRHRGVSKAAFNEANNVLVWTETLRVLTEWFETLDESHSKTLIKDALTIEIVDHMVQATLLVISAAGFGRRVSWKDDSLIQPPQGHTLTFRTSVTSTLHNLFFKILTPDWLCELSSSVYIPYLSRRLAEMKEAFKGLRLHIHELISVARAGVLDGKGVAGDGGSGAALLRNLVEANMTQDGEIRRLTDDELLSNIFVFLLAGHETSAHALSFAIVLLALYPDAQQKIYEEAMEVWPEGTDPLQTSTYKDDHPLLEYTMAVFREALRLFPSVPRLAKPVFADSVVTVNRFNPADDYWRESKAETVSVAIPKGSVVIIDVWASHMNPLHWGPDAEEFKPERFIDTETYRWPRDAFLAFSAGARGCIGKRFSLTESICILACLVRRYEILIPEDLLEKGLEERKRVLLSWVLGVTVTPTNARVRVRRRGQ
ncbi:hypothetical protein JAAARDRAFT_35408 [Jaapia argillacea MUCL 33604]|uniref:Cytochrome P450 n=1 Tax=Jaapia argillacea MUCL 33604 TaxID=933084 RepID=A0A067PV30_9AGAM|nr:hypothetical protein JAAARDRAFT_35408 [Jaapia argillacea MUCL 33604]